MQVLISNEDLFKKMIEINTHSYNVDKALEESTEFNEVILKRKTKSKDNPKRPLDNELIDEYGDMVFRGIVYLMMEFPNLTIEQLLYQISYRINDKTNTLKKKLLTENIIDKL